MLMSSMGTEHFGIRSIKPTISLKSLREGGIDPESPLTLNRPGFLQIDMACGGQILSPL